MRCISCKRAALYINLMQAPHCYSLLWAQRNIFFLNEKAQKKSNDFQLFSFWVEVDVRKFCPTIIIIIAFKSSTAADSGINDNSSGNKMVSSYSCKGLK